MIPLLGHLSSVTVQRRSEGDSLKSGHQTIADTESSCLPNTRHCPVSKFHLLSVPSFTLSVTKDMVEGDILPDTFIETTGESYGVT